jgi:hypothetical protein
MAHLKKSHFGKKFDRVSPLLALIFFLITGAHCTVVRWQKMLFFSENDLFDPGIGYYTPKISLEKCFSRFSSAQWSIFTIHSGPLGGNSQKWVSTVVRWAETAKNGPFLCFCTKSGMFFSHHILLHPTTKDHCSGKGLKIWLEN